MPLPMVLATAVPKRNAATKLKNAAHITASLGESTRVETMVATLLAASWKPFRKSNVSARRIVMRTTRVWVVTVCYRIVFRLTLRIFKHDGLQHIGCIFGFVGAHLQGFV